MSDDQAPPVPGNWVVGELAGTGRWSLGKTWVDSGAARLALKVGAEHCNAYGVMHGGAMATFADAQIIAVRTYTGEEANHTPTITLSVDYIAPASEGSWLVAETTFLRATQTMLFTQAVIRIGERVVARSNAIYRNNPKGRG